MALTLDTEKKHMYEVFTGIHLSDEIPSLREDGQADKLLPLTTIFTAPAHGHPSHRLVRRHNATKRPYKEINVNARGFMTGVHWIIGVLESATNSEHMLEALDPTRKLHNDGHELSQEDAQLVADMAAKILDR